MFMSKAPPKVIFYILKYCSLHSNIIVYILSYKIIKIITDIVFFNVIVVTSSVINRSTELVMWSDHDLRGPQKLT